MPSSVFSRRNRSRGLASHLAIALALASGGIVAGVAVPAPAFAQNADNSRAFGQAAQSAVDLVNGLKDRTDLAPVQQQYDNATTEEARQQATQQLLGMVSAERQALDGIKGSIETEGDRNLYGQLVYLVGVAARSPALLAEGLGQQLDSGLVPAEEKMRYAWDAGRFFYGAGDHANASKYLDMVLELSPHDGTAIGLKAEAMANMGQSAEGLAFLRSRLQQAREAGQTASPDVYRRGILIAQNEQNLQQMVAVSTDLAEAHPSPQNWTLAMDVLRQASRYPDPELLDLYRLMQHSNSFGSENDIKEYIELADKSGLPGEVLLVLDGTASNPLRSNGDQYYADFRQLAEDKAAADRRDLPAAKSDAEAADASAQTAASTADAFLSYGDSATAEALYRSALAKDGGDRDRLMTRLGIALLDQGKVQEAKDMLSQVGGAREPLARLWLIYAGQQQPSA